MCQLSQGVCLQRGSRIRETGTVDAAGLMKPVGERTGCRRANKGDGWGNSPHKEKERSGLT